MYMRAPQDQLEKIKNLIKNDFKQEAAHLLRQFLQKEPTNRRAWLLLSEITSGQAKVMCLEKAAACPVQDSSPEKSQTQSQLESESINDLTIPYASFAGVRAKARQKSAPIRPKRQPAVSQKSMAVKSTQTLHDRDFSIGRWLAIGLVGVALGIISVFVLTRFAPNLGFNNQVSAQTLGEAELVPAIVETAKPTVQSEISNSEEDDPTELAEAIIPTKEVVEEIAEVEVTPTPEPTAQQLAAKPIGENNESRAAWTPTPSPTPTIEPTRLSDLTSFEMPYVGEDERWVDVNLTLQTLTAYEGKSPVMQTIISSGRPPYYTVTGQFRVYYRLPEQTMDGRSLGFDYVTPGVPHVQYFYGNFAIHGATWHNDFGTPVSHGCVNVTPVDAEWLYNWMSYGTLVSVHY